MAQLPTITVNDNQLAILVEAFGDQAGYNEWLRNALRNEVRVRRIDSLDKAYQTSRIADVNEYLDTLSDIAPPPPEESPI